MQNPAEVDWTKINNQLEEINVEFDSLSHLIERNAEISEVGNHVQKLRGQWQNFSHAVKEIKSENHEDQNSLQMQLKELTFTKDKLSEQLNKYNTAISNLSMTRHFTAGQLEKKENELIQVELDLQKI